MRIKTSLKKLTSDFLAYIKPNQNPTGLKAEDIGGISKENFDKAYSELTTANFHGIDRIGLVDYFPLSINRTGTPNGKIKTRGMYKEDNGDIVELGVYNSGLEYGLYYNKLFPELKDYEPIMTKYTNPWLELNGRTVVDMTYLSYSPNALMVLTAKIDDPNDKIWLLIKLNGTFNGARHESYPIETPVGLYQKSMCPFFWGDHVWLFCSSTDDKDRIYHLMNIPINELSTDTVNKFVGVKGIKTIGIGGKEYVNEGHIQIADEFIGRDPKLNYVVKDMAENETKAESGYGESSVMVSLNSTGARFILTTERYYANIPLGSQYQKHMSQIDIDLTTFRAKLDPRFGGNEYTNNGVLNSTFNGEFPTFPAVFYQNSKGESKCCFGRNELGIYTLKLDKKVNDDQPLNLLDYQKGAIPFKGIEYLFATYRDNANGFGSVFSMIKPLSNTQGVAFVSSVKNRVSKNGYAKFEINKPLDYDYHRADGVTLKGYKPYRIPDDLMRFNDLGVNSNNTLVYTCINDKIESIASTYYNNQFDAYQKITTDAKYNIVKSGKQTIDPSLHDKIYQQIKKLYPTTINNDLFFWEVISFNGSLNRSYIFVGYNLSDSTGKYLDLYEANEGFNGDILNTVVIGKQLQHHHSDTQYPLRWKLDTYQKPDSIAVHLTNENKWIMTLVYNVSNVGQGDSQWVSYDIVYDATTSESVVNNRKTITSSILNQDYHCFVPGIGYNIVSRYNNMSSNRSVVYAGLPIKTSAEFISHGGIVPANTGHILATQILPDDFSFEIPNNIKYLINGFTGELKTAKYDLSQMGIPYKSKLFKIALKVDTKGNPTLVVNETISEDQSTIIFGEIETGISGIIRSELRKVTRVFQKRLSTISIPNGIVVSKGTWKDELDLSGWKK